MKRKTSEIPTKVYKFGCRLSPAAKQVVREEHLRAAHNYYNALIEIELDRRRLFREARAKIADLEPLEKVVDDLSAKIQAARDEINEVRKKDRLRTKQPEKEALIKSLLADIKIAKSVRDNARKLLKDDPELLAEVDQIDEAANERIKAAYAAADIFWGTKLLVARAVDAARRSKIDPKFKRWSGCGQVGVQIQQDLSTEGLFDGKSNFLQIDPMPEDQWDTRSGRRHAYTTARMRVGSNGHAPVWVEFEVLLHRKLPFGAIKWASIQIEQVGIRSKYTLQITLESDAFPKRENQGLTAAFQLGWTTLKEGPNAGVMIGNLLDTNGFSREFVVPSEIPAKLNFANSLKQASDNVFNDAVSALKNWLSVYTPPEWVTEATETLAYWRDHKKLAAVAYRWVREKTQPEQLEKLWGLWKGRKAIGKDLWDTLDAISVWLSDQGVKDTEAQIAIYLEWWRRKNLHLYQVEANTRCKAIGHRREVFRVWAAELATIYSKIVVEDWDLSEMARNASPEQSAEADHTHKLRTQVAPSELRKALPNVYKLPTEALSCPVCHKPECSCKVPSQFARCWYLLQRAGEDTTGVRKVWEASLKFTSETVRMAVNASL